MLPRKGLTRHRATATVMLCAVALTVLGAGTSYADSVAITGNATSITSTSAVVHGTVNSSNGGTYFFQYGTTTAYGHVTPIQTIGAGSRAVSATLSSLDPATTYHFRLVVQQGGYSFPNTGGDNTFVTPPPPGTIAVTGNATSVTTTSAMLNGVANPSDGNSAWAFQYGTSPSYGKTTKVMHIGAGLRVLAIRISGLRARTRYHFRLIVTQGSSPPREDSGADRKFTTKRYGKASFRRHRLKVINGAVSIPMKCSGPAGALCIGRILLSTKNSSGKTVHCASAKYSSSGGQKSKVSATLGKSCRTLLGAAKGHRLHGRFRGKFKHQAPLKKAVTLVG